MFTLIITCGWKLWLQLCNEQEAIATLTTRAGEKRESNVTVFAKQKYYIKY